MATPTYKKISRTTGQGTAEDPELNWTCDAPGGKKGRPSPLRDGCEKLVRQVAVEHGFTHAWIRSVPHSTTWGINNDTKDENKKETCDCHITVYFGNEDNVATKSGHVYVVMDGKVPTRLMRVDEREDNGPNPELSDWPFVPEPSQ